MLPRMVFFSSWSPQYSLVQQLWWKKMRKFFRKSLLLGYVVLPKFSLTVVPTHLKNMLKSNWIRSQGSGWKYKMFETATSLDFPQTRDFPYWTTIWGEVVDLREKNPQQPSHKAAILRQPACAVFIKAAKRSKRSWLPFLSFFFQEKKGTRSKHRPNVQLEMFARFQWCFGGEKLSSWWFQP